MVNSPSPIQMKRKRGIARYLVRYLLNTFFLLLVLLALGILSFFIFPPFGNEPVARIVLVGADEPETPGAARRSDTIMLCAARMNGTGATLLSIPRDARVRIPHHRGQQKINAAFAYGKIPLLKETLADPDLLHADLPYFLIVDSKATRAIVDALGGVEVNVAHAMNYDDAWGKLHIHLKEGHQRLNGEQAVGFLRWRKNNHGDGGNSTDFERTAHQRELLTGLSNEIRSPRGLLRLPALYMAFRANTQSNLNIRQLMMLAWCASRKTDSNVVPGQMRIIRGTSYVLCDWRKGREIWENATR